MTRLESLFDNTLPTLKKNSVNLDLLNVIFLLFTMVNHHRREHVCVFSKHYLSVASTISLTRCTRACQKASNVGETQCISTSCRFAHCLFVEDVVMKGKWMVLAYNTGCCGKEIFWKKKDSLCFNCKIPSLSSDGMLLPLKPWSSKVERIPFTLRYLEHFGYSPVLWTVNIYSLRKPHNTWKSEIPKEICSNDWFSKRAW